MIMKFAICIALGIAAVAVDAQQQQDRENDIVVEGRRSVLAGGDWAIHLSRAYTFGTAINAEDLRPIGADRTWHICLAATDVEPLIRMLVGEGQTSSATARCSRLQVRLGRGKLRATQSCFGTTMMAKSGDPDRISIENGANGRTGIGPGISNDHDVPASPAAAPIQARNTLTVTGRYAVSSLSLDFADVQEPEVLAPNPNGPPLRNERHWSIKGQRQGECAKPVPK